MTSPGAGLAVGVLLYQGCIVAEVVEVATRLGFQGATVHWVSPDGAAITDESGLGLTPSSSIAALPVDVLDALVVPGGDPESVMGLAAVQGLVNRTAELGVVAGICAGVLVLADAGVLAGRAATHNYRPPWMSPQITQSVAHLFEGVLVEPDPAVGVVRDDRTITALPNAAAEFSIQVCRSLGIYDERRASLLVRHLRGEFVPELVAEPVDRAPQPSTQVRAATTGDMTRVTELQSRLFTEDAGVYEPFVDLSWSEREGPADFAELLASDSSVVLVAEAHDTIIGFLAGYLSPPTPTRQPVTFAVLRSLYVLNDRRSAGAGAALTEEFIGWARSQGAVEAHVSAYVDNARAHQLYARCGFASRSTTRVKPLVGLADDE